MKRVVGRVRAALPAVGIFIALTVFMTWPQVRWLGSQAVPHQDVYFNMWRLEWIAHAMVTPSAAIFDGNIFYPEHDTLALSDAMLVEGTIAAPLIWLGLRPVLVHNLMMLGPIALSGVAIFVLIRYLTGSRGAAVLGGIVFAFAPYRFEHFMHMELQWTIWMPLAFYALHRTLDHGGLKWGVITGLMVALQMLSSIYYGIFLGTLLGVTGVLLILFDRKVSWRVAVVPLLVGGALAAAVSAAYSIPYMRARARVGERGAEQIVMFSARPSNYLIATPTNWLYGSAFESRGRGERRLFPGLVVVMLAIVGLLLKPPSARMVVYLLALILAFETSLGFRGFVYGHLYQYVLVYRGLRAPARLGIFVVMFLAVLGSYGYAHIARTLSAPARRALFGVLTVALLIEYSVTLELTPYINEVPPVYKYLSKLPRGVVADLPVPRLNALPGQEAEYAYLSIFHWFPIVNGYSGAYPPSYIARVERLRGFPDETSRKQLRRDGVRYVILHANHVQTGKLGSLLEELDRAGEFAQLGAFNDGSGIAYLYSLR
jgi:hypothetical protein